jgi:hypothetical protein
MPRPRFSTWIAGSALAAVLLASPAAAGKAAVGLTLPGADAGTAVRYSFTSAHVPAADTLVIQRQVGTARRYKTVATLPHVASGTGSLPALSLGRYVLRIAVLEPRRVKHRLRMLVRAQQKRILPVFGTVPFATLFRSSVYTFTTPARSFSYVFSRIYVGNVETVVTVDAKANTCRSVHVDWVANGHPGDSGEVSLVQEERDAVTDDAAAEDISGFDAVVTPRQSWSINAASLGPGLLGFYVNGSASCYSRSLLG